MKLKRFEIALICAVLASFLVGFVVDCGAQARELSDKLIRLHVVANSDSEEDQAMKLAVRDAVLEVVRRECEGVSEVSEARQRLLEAMPELVAAGTRVVAEWGADYQVTATLCRESFPTTEYDQFSLPAGEYESLRIRIGQAGGHNWWCVVFPPVCDRPAFDPGSAAALGLTGEEARLMTRSSGKYVVRFKTVELIQKVMEWIGLSKKP